VQLSVVATMYCSAPYLAEFRRRVLAVAADLGIDCEIVFVNDGSPDDALRVAVRLMEEDARVRVVDLSRNFGHHKAMMAGLEHARGERVFLIDVDLEEPPESLAAMWRTMADGQDPLQPIDVVFGVQSQRPGSAFTRLTGHLFYRAFNALSYQSVPLDPLTARLMTRRYVDALLRHREHLFNIEGLWEITGYRQVPLEVNKQDHDKPSTYSFVRKLHYVFVAVTAFSRKPLYGVLFGGAALLAAAALWLVVAALRSALGSGVTPVEWLLLGLGLATGLVLTAIGIVAVYVAAVVVETKARPYTVVRNVYERSR
jgi:putative glycosyltransferase